jgi:hypothetical protein
MSVYASAVTLDNNMIVLTDPHPGFEFSIAALGLKPGASNLNYVILNKALPAQSPTWHEQELQPAYTGAFNLGIGYQFANSGGKDVTLDWTHLNSTTSDTTIAPNANYFLGPDYQIGPEGIPIRNANGKVKFNYNVINLLLGQTVHFGEHMAVRFFGGLSNSYLHEDVTAIYAGNTCTFCWSI